MHIFAYANITPPCSTATRGAQGGVGDGSSLGANLRDLPTAPIEPRGEDEVVAGEQEEGGQCQDEDHAGERLGLAFHCLYRLLSTTLTLRISLIPGPTTLMKYMPGATDRNPRFLPSQLAQYSPASWVPR